MQKEVLTSHKLQDHTRVTKSFQIKGGQPLTEKLPESTESPRFIPHRAKMSGELDSRKESQSTKFK